ncbi:hypothetical protein R6Z07M_014692 [Ovis aries]
MEAQCWRRARPEPALPPGLNREQAWAWALDNFPALSRPSCLSPEFCGDAHYCACGLPRHACPGPADGLRVEMGQKRWREPQGHQPAASPGWSDSPVKKRPKPPSGGPSRNPEHYTFASKGSQKTSLLPAEAMEHFPRCVRQAWDSAEEPQEPEVRQLLRSVNPKEWQLPCYPRLGELSPDEEDFNRGRTFGPLPPSAPTLPQTPTPRTEPLHAIRPVSGSRPHTRSRPGVPAPSGQEDAARPESFPDPILPQEEPSV